MLWFAFSGSGAKEVADLEYTLSLSANVGGNNTTLNKTESAISFNPVLCVGATR